MLWLLAILSVASLGFLYKRRAEVSLFLRARWRYVVGAEVLFIAAYLVFVMVRAANPDLWHPWRGGEKPMDLAYLTAVVRSTTMPPYDPWYAGRLSQLLLFRAVYRGSTRQGVGHCPHRRL